MSESSFSLFCQAQILISKQLRKPVLMRVIHTFEGVQCDNETSWLVN